LKARGEFALVKQRLEAALVKPGQPVNFGTGAHDHELYMMLCECAVEMRDGAALNQWAPRLMELAQRDQHRLYTAIAARGLGVAQRMAGRLSESAESLQAALALFTELATPWQRGRTLMELGDLALAGPKRGKAKAREYYTDAASLFDEIGAAPAAARARERLEVLA
jgi:hypothetical protein